MSLEEFKLFLKKYVVAKERFQDRERLMVGTFQNQLVTRALIEMRFNPLNRKDWLNRFLDKFLEDEEVETLWKKM